MECLRSVKGRSSIVSQLSSQGLVGTRPLLEYTWWWIFFFGDDLYDSSRITWMPMSHDYSKHYSPGTKAPLCRETYWTEIMKVIGDISMQDKMVIYDNERQLLGCESKDCSRPPKPKAFAAIDRKLLAVSLYFQIRIMEAPCIKPSLHLGSSSLPSHL
ncbi:uncharacterized protein LOC120290249 [Eucalyptus grandis]|uniref:uncharacterized protein LOC120290249 n=1 Tax=Eucalyptus grandis TaxID=71139 RepID=UPI00192E9434|nr:uncharacterized protein LOC120290249 [Eucalyptus grandis]XP_039162003.1 uncharacterized protein LOC120290249 [Eucalyptus grandis]